LFLNLLLLWKVSSVDVLVGQELSRLLLGHHHDAVVLSRPLGRCGRGQHDGELTSTSSKPEIRIALK